MASFGMLLVQHAVVAFDSAILKGQFGELVLESVNLLEVAMLFDFEIFSVLLLALTGSEAVVC